MCSFSVQKIILIFISIFIDLINQSHYSSPPDAGCLGGGVL